MTSRDIANMHVFLEMKKKFPDLPEDTIRNHVSLYSSNRDACISILERKSKPYFNINQSFPEEEKLAYKQNASNIPSSKYTKKEMFFTESKRELVDYNKTTNLDVARRLSGRSSSHAGIIQSKKQSTVNYRALVQSAPVQDSPPPFSNIYTNVPVTSQSHKPYSTLDDNRIIFSTTKEHTILPSDKNKNYNQSIFKNVDKPKNHSVSLNITPSFPYQQQQISTYNDNVASSSLIRSGRHTTSVNFQLQPHSSGSPVHISSVPTNTGNPSNFKDFGSHVQISVGSQGATFTALRLHRPLASQLSSQDSMANISLHYPSQIQNLSFQRNLQSDFQVSSIKDDSFKQPQFSLNSSPKSGKQIEQKSHNTSTNFAHGYQASPDYVNAVKKHQLAQLELLAEEVNKERSSCLKLKSEVSELEKKLDEIRYKEDNFSHSKNLQKLKNENRDLRVEVNCLFMEYDAISKGRIPVGLTDENFYSNIFTGPDDGFILCSNGDVKNYHKEIFNRAEEIDDEENKWLCKKCTFANHPALEKCEMCELPKNSGSFFAR